MAPTERLRHDRPAPGKKKAGLLVKLVLLVFVLCVTLGVSEGVLWAMGFEYIPVEIRLIDESDWRDYHVFRDVNFEYDRDLIWKPRAGFGVFNEDGYRGPRLERHKPEGQFRVIAVGDSNTLGSNGEDGANWPRYYGELLREAGIDAVVANAGVWGYTTYQGVVRLRQMLELDPDLVLFSFGGNDCQFVMRSDSEFAGDPVRQTKLDALLMSVRFGQLVLKAMDARPRPSPGEGMCRVPKDEYRQNLLEAIAMCREKGVAIVLMTRPYLPFPHVEDPYFWSKIAPAYRRIDIEVAKEHDVLLVDFKARFPDNPKDEPLYLDDSHFTEHGHRLAAEFLFEQTRPLLPLRK